jgi:hypothetical protein
VAAQMTYNNTVMFCNTSAHFFYLKLFAIDGIYVVEDVALQLMEFTLLKMWLCSCWNLCC